MNIAFFGSSLLSAYWNGAATYYRGIIRAMHARGHRVTFYEPDAFDRQAHCDLEPPEWATVRVYSATKDGVSRAMEQAAGADLVVKASGVGVFDEFLERELLRLKNSSTAVAFWDVDAPATLDRIHADPADPFRSLIPQYSAIFTYGGGAPVVNAYTALNAQLCVPIYNALDPDTHHPVPPSDTFCCDLAFLGNRLPDREARVEEFFLSPAASLPNRTFALAGSGWGDKPRTRNIRYFEHLYTRDHNAFNCSARIVLNVSRQSMAKYGFSPATRVFEAAGAAACVLTDAWEGLDYFFEPDTEILVAYDGGEVAEFVTALPRMEAEAIGRAAYRRALAHHTYSQRAEQLESVLEGISLSRTGALA